MGFKEELPQVLRGEAAALFDEFAVARPDVECARGVGDELGCEDARGDKARAGGRHIADAVGDEILDRPLPVGDSALPIVGLERIDYAEEFAVGVLEVNDGGESLRQCHRRS
jgi:hypothetical protein